MRSSYGDTSDVVAMLAEAYAGQLSARHIGDLINEVQHQGGTSTAMYAAAPHLIAIARKVEPEMALTLLTHAGLIHAHSRHRAAVPCPEFLQKEFRTSAADGSEMLARLLPLTTSFDAYKWAVAGLAGFLGHHDFARFLDGLDFHEGRFHHLLIGGPFPSEDGN